MPTTALEVLDIIDTLLARENRESRYLWNVLTALRGPDSEDEPLKVATTAGIRTATFPLTAAAALTLSEGLTSRFANGALFGHRPVIDVTQKGKGDSLHFWRHVVDAAHTLKKIGRKITIKRR
jgi:hypothetical protein